MHIEAKIRQSKIRVSSGLRLLVFLACLDLGLYALEIFAAVKIVAGLLAFFVFTTLFELWNVRRLERLVEKQDDLGE